MPVHTHSAHADAQGNHTHIFYGINTPTERDQPGVGAAMHATSTAGSYNNRIAAAGNHTHNISIANTGGSNRHNNMQPYIAIYYWLRMN